MKKSFLALPLAVILETGVLASCTLYVKDGYLIQIGPDTYKIADIMDSQAYTVTAAKSYYTLLKNVYTQLAFPRDSNMDLDVDAKVQKDYYEAAETNAKNNGTTQQEERENILDNAGVDSLSEYRDSLYLAEQTTAASDSFYSDNNINTSLLNDYIEEDWPYHVKHILVKVDADDNDYHRGEISSDNAKNIANVVERLASGDETFGDVALSMSEDTGSDSTTGKSSKEQYGDLGIMDKNTSYVAEFKLGTYAFDMYYNKDTASTSYTLNDSTVTAASALGPSTGSTASSLLSTSFDYGSGSYDNAIPISAIPYTSAVALDYYSETDKSDSGHDVTNATENNYPRNVIFNSYYNNHAPSLIYFDDVSDLTTLFDIDSDDPAYAEAESVIENASFKTASEVFKDSSLLPVQWNYSVDLDASDADDVYNPTATQIDPNAKILTDEQGNPILVVRAGTSSSSSDSDSSSSSGYEGIHFIVVQKDPFDTGAADTDSALSTLNDYYNVSLANAQTSGVSNFVNYIYSTDSDDYNNRAKVIKNAVKATDSNMDFKLYDYIKDKALETYTVDATSIESRVDQYIDSTEAQNDYTSQTSYDTAWSDYVKKVNFQFNSQSMKEAVPTSAITDFNNGSISYPYIAKTASGSWEYSATIGTEYGIDYINNPAYLSSTINGSSTSD